MDETYGTYVDDECFDLHNYDDDTLTIILRTILLMMILPSNDT